MPLLKFQPSYIVSVQGGEFDSVKFKAIEWADIDWIDLAEYRDKLVAVEKAEMNLRVPQKAGDFFLFLTG